MSFNIWSDNCLSIETSRQTFEKALIFFDIFIKIAEGEGLQVWNTESATFIGDAEVKIQIRLREKTTRKEKEINQIYKYYDFLPIGKLSFIYGSSNYNTFQEGKNPLVYRIPSIILRLQEEIEEKNQRKMESERKKVSEAQKAKKKRKLYKIKINEYSKFKELESMYEKWEMAEKLRKLIKLKEASGASKFWINWATAKANYIDPLIDTEDPLLGSYPFEEPKKPERYYDW